jgi:pimeloyl-ACP methyl ester carboxylesterase
VPSLFISGANDWGIYQAPGAIHHMRDYVCREMRDIILIDNAGHWVQQEQHDAVFDGIASFLKTN